MERFKVAHIREQGQDIIIISVASSFGFKSNTEQNQLRAALQVCASTAGLAGMVVPVWDTGGGRMGFLAPAQWRSYFSGMTLSFVAININRELTCG